MTTTTETMMKDQVLSWLNDEETVVTAQRISQTTTRTTTNNNDDNSSGGGGLSRKDASELLKTIWNEVEDEDDEKYLATICTMETTKEEGYSTTVFQLQSRKRKSDVLLNSDNTTVFALALNTSSSSSSSSMEILLESAHEKDMAQMRDAVQDKDYEDLLKYQSAIQAPAEQQVLNGASGTAGADIATMQGSDLVSKGSTQNQHYVAHKKKVSLQKPVTAKAFFGSNNSKNKNSTKTAALEEGEEKTKKTNSTSTAAAAAAKNTKSSKGKSSSTTTEKENSGNCSRSSSKSSSKSLKPAATKEEEDTAAAAAADDGNVVGNADDFIGDEDEDSDDERDLELHQKKARQEDREQKQEEAIVSSKSSKTKRNRKTQAQVEEEMRLEEAARKESGMNNSDDDDDDDAAQFKGAMDAFATRKKAALVIATNSTLPPGKKRIKRLVEKMTKDANGYLKTTMEVEWAVVDANTATANKDDDDDTDKANQKSTSFKPTMPKKKSVVHSADLKQKGIMGFFAKK